MKYFLIAIFLLAASCAQPKVESFDPPTATAVPTLAPNQEAHCIEGECDIVTVVTAAPPPEIAPTPTNYTPEPERTNWLLLGGDYREHREGTGWGNKTDVMVMISILESDPVEITVVQFPRNLYVPSSAGDTWMFAVWNKSGWDGFGTYFDEVFGVELTGIFYINMDNFVTLVDGLGEIKVRDAGGSYVLGGEDTLSYLRDNENNWGYRSYDHEQRVFSVVDGLLDAVGNSVISDPVSTMALLLREYGDLIESNLSVEEYYWLAIIGSKMLGDNPDTRFVQLEQPYVIRGDTPIIQDEQPTRGLVAGRDWNIPDGPAGLSDSQILTIWMRACAFGNGECK